MDVDRDPLAGAPVGRGAREELSRSLGALERQLQALHELLRGRRDAGEVLAQLAAARRTLTTAAAALIVESCSGGDPQAGERAAQAVQTFVAWERGEGDRSPPEEWP